MVIQTHDAFYAYGYFRYSWKCIGICSQDDSSCLAGIFGCPDTHGHSIPWCLYVFFCAKTTKLGSIILHKSNLSMTELFTEREKRSTDPCKYENSPIHVHRLIHVWTVPNMYENFTVWVLTDTNLTCYYQFFQAYDASVKNICHWIYCWVSHIIMMTWFTCLSMHGRNTLHTVHWQAIQMVHSHLFHTQLMQLSKIMQGWLPSHKFHNVQVALLASTKHCIIFSTVPIPGRLTRKLSWIYATNWLSIQIKPI